MSRRIGDYTDPKTGEKHWFEPETVSQYPLPNQRLLILGNSEHTIVEFELSNNDTAATIDCVAKVTINGEVIRSEKASMNELVFADLTFDAYVSQHTFSTKKEVIAYQDIAINSLKNKLLNEKNLLTNGLDLEGFVFVNYGDDRVAVSDNMHVSFATYNSDLQLEVKDVVSKTTIIEEKSPTIGITLPNGITRLFRGVRINEVESGIVSNYNFVTDKDSTSSLSGESFIKLPAKDEVFTEESAYIKEALTLLASDALEENSVDSLFDDLLEL